MKYEYKNNYIINYSDVNPKLQLGLVGTIGMLENIVTDYYSGLEQGNYTIQKKYNSVWVYTKIKIKFNKIPKLTEQIKAVARAVKVTPVRNEIETTIQNEKNEDIILAKHETCVIDVEKRKAKRLSEVNYPEKMEVFESNNIGEFSKLKEEFNESDLIYEQKVYYADIDFSKHTNNVMYIRFIVNSLPLKFWMENEVEEFEIHYITETREGEELEIYRKQEGKEIKFLIKSNEKEIVRAKIKIK